MASPQLENGYTRIANELLEAIIAAKLNGTQYAVIIALIRATYGFHLKSRTLGLAFFEKQTGRHKRQIAVEIDKLIKRNILIVVRPHSEGISRELQFNKDYQTWLQIERGMSEDTHRAMSKLIHLGMSEIAH